MTRDAKRAAGGAGLGLMVIGALLPACGGGGGGAPDARPTDAAVVVADAPGSSPVHTVYLNFEGQALTPGNDNPATNTSVLLSAPYTVPAFLPSDAQRTTKIAAIVSEAQGVLAPYDVTLTTTRPTSGAYDMIVVGGTSQAAGFPGGVGSVAPVTCPAAMGAGTRVDLVFDNGGTLSAHIFAQAIVAITGVNHAVPQSTKAGDCMCYSAPSCTAPTAACTIGGPGTPAFTDSTMGACPGQAATMDEGAEWLKVYGAHP